MKNTNCFSCSEEMSITKSNEAICNNETCKEKGTFVICGYCKEYSFNVLPVSKMRCINPRCAVYNKIRYYCPFCKKVARIVHNDIEVCLNRECGSNIKYIQKCYFCNNISFINLEGIQFCSKRECNQVFETVLKCKKCNNYSYLVSKSKCGNTNCNSE